MSDLYCMTVPLREITAHEAISMIQALRAEVLCARAESSKYRDKYEVLKLDLRDKGDA